MLRQRPNRSQIGLCMGVPGIIPGNVLQAIGGKLLPKFRIFEDSHQRLGNRRLIQRIDQQTVTAIADDVHRTAVFGSDQRQTAGGRFQQRQAEWFGQGRIDEHTPGCSGKAINVGDVVSRVVFRQSDPTVEIVIIGNQQQLRQNPLRAFAQLPDVFTITGDDHQIG